MTEFGIAKRSGGLAHDLTHTGAIVGSPAYMAPEQARGDSKFVGPQADVWALGVVLYECLTGRRPFTAGDTFAVLKQVIEADPARPRSLAPGTPRDLDLICRKCLGKAVGERYETAAALADDLARFLDGRAVAARPVSAAVQGWKWARRRPALAGLLALGAAVAVGLPPLAVWSQGRLTTARVGQERTAEKLRAEQALAATREQFALLETLRKRSAGRSPGWAADNLADLAAKGGVLTDPAARVAARGEAVTALTAVRLAPLPPLAAGGQVATARSSPALAVGEAKAVRFVSPLHVWLLDPATGAMRRQVATPPKLFNRNSSGQFGQDGVFRLALSGDGTAVYAGTRGGSVARWHPADPAEAPATTFAVSAKWVVDVALSPDDRTLYAAAEDDTCRAGRQTAGVGQAGRPDAGRRR